MPDPVDPGENEIAPTRLLDGRLLLRQPLKGHRAGTDAVLLAAAATLEPNGVFVDVGAGVGTVGLALALRDPSATGHLVEQAADLVDLARQNAELNGLVGRLHVHHIDLFDRGARGALAGKAGLVVTNPPFYLAGRSRASSDRGKASAHVLNGPDPTDGHAAWMLAALSFVAPHGSLVMIHRPDALPALLAAAAGRLGGVTVRPVHAFAGRAAIRILFGGIAGSRAPFSIAAPLILHRDDGSFTGEAEGLHRGDVSPLLRPRKRPAKAAGPLSSR
jgi:tRNA1(Val) A37 N6-methylase TrmN6